MISHRLKLEVFIGEFRMQVSIREKLMAILSNEKTFLFPFYCPELTAVMTELLIFSQTDEQSSFINDFFYCVFVVYFDVRSQQQQPQLRSLGLCLLIIH